MARPSLGGVPGLLAGLDACWSCSTPTIKALCGIDCSVWHLGSTCMAGLLSILFGPVQPEDGLHMFAYVCINTPGMGKNGHRDRSALTVAETL